MEHTQEWQPFMTERGKAFEHQMHIGRMGRRGNISSHDPRTVTSVASGLSFGITSGVITTLGLMIGLSSGTKSKVAVLGGILTIAIADACSDAMGIYASEETKSRPTFHMLMAVGCTFLTKFLTALTFAIPVLLFTIIVCICWSAFLLFFLSVQIAFHINESVFEVLAEHIAISAVVVFLSNYIGNLISEIFDDDKLIDDDNNDGQKEKEIIE